MNGRLPLLAGVLAAQILLVAVLSLSSGQDSDAGALLDVSAGAVSGIDITDAQGASLTLVKADEGWQFADGVSADDGKVSALLERLATMISPWPVANTDSSATRFEVAETGFQRHVVLRAGDEVLADLYLGTSPGYRRVHARNADSDDIYSIEFANHEVPTGADEWLDATQLQTTGITQVQLHDGWTLAQAADGWQLDSQVADSDAAGKLVERLGQLRLIGRFDGDEANLADPQRLLVTDAEGVQTLELRHDAENDEYVIESDRLTGRFTVASYIAEQILVDADSLLPAVESPTSSDAQEGQLDVEASREIDSGGNPGSGTGSESESGLESVQPSGAIPG